MSPRDRLAAFLAPDLLDAFEELVAERVAAEVAALSRDEGRPWLTLEEAADRLACSPNAVRMRANRGRLETRRQGRRRYVSAASVAELA